MNQATDGKSPARMDYAPPKIQVMSEDDILKNFQVTSAQGAWWVPTGSGSL